MDTYKINTSSKAAYTELVAAAFELTPTELKYLIRIVCMAKELPYISSEDKRAVTNYFECEHQSLYNMISKLKKKNVLVDKPHRKGYSRFELGVNPALDLSKKNIEFKIIWNAEE
jgi:hypothetical protein